MKVYYTVAVPINNLYIARAVDLTFKWIADDDQKLHENNISARRKRSNFFRRQKRNFSGINGLVRRRRSRERIKKPKPELNKEVRDKLHKWLYDSVENHYMHPSKGISFQFYAKENNHNHIHLSCRESKSKRKGSSSPILRSKRNHRKRTRSYSNLNRSRTPYT